MLTGGGNCFNYTQRGEAVLRFRAGAVCVVCLHACFTFAAKVRIFWGISRFLGVFFWGCAQESLRGGWRGRFFCMVCHPRCYWRRCAQRLYHAPACARSWFAYAPIGRRFGIPLLSFPPPSGNPGRPYAGYCAAANRLAGVHPRTRPPGCRIKCGMTAQTRRLCCPRGCCRGCHRLPPARKCAQGLPLSALNRTFAD